MDEITSFGTWLKHQRKAHDVTQSDLAWRTGCATVTLQKIEAEERRPSKEVVARLAEALAIPPDEQPTFLRVARGELPVKRLPGMPVVPTTQPPALPTGTVTWLFTDIAGSTALWEQQPTAMRHALVRHDALVEQFVAAHQGQLVRPRGEGDSRFAVFARATAVVAATVAFQQALQAKPWPTPPSACAWPCTRARPTSTMVTTRSARTGCPARGTRLAIS